MYGLYSKTAYDGARTVYKNLHIEPFNTVSKSVCFGFTYSSRY